MATYRELVTAKSPTFYYTLDESSGNITNYGSVGGTGTATGLQNYGSGTAAPAIPGTSIYFASNASSNITQTGASTSSGGFTYGFWYKRNTAFSLASRRIIRIQTTTSNYQEISITGTNGYLRLFDTAGHNDGPTVAAIVDGNWHFIVIRVATNTAEYFVDGVSVGSTAGTVQSKSGASIIVGGNTTTTGPGAWLDEVATWPSYLTATEIQNMYQAATAVAQSVTVQAPAMSSTITTPNVNVRLTKDVRAVAPAMAATITTPAPVVGVRVKVTAPPMVTSLTVKDAIVTAETEFDNTVRPYADRARNGQGTVSPISADINFAPQIYFGFDLTKSAQNEFTNLDFTVTVTSTAGTANVTIYPLLQPVVESQTTNIEGKGGIVYSLSLGKNTFSLSEIVGFLNNGDTIYGIGIGNLSSQKIASREATNPADRPSLRRRLRVAPVSKTISAPPMVATISTPDVKTNLTRNITVFAPAMILSVPTTNVIPRTDTRVQVGPMAASVSTLPAVVKTTGNRIISAPAMTLDLTFTGGKENITSPNTKVLANPMIGYVFTPNPEVKAGKDARIVVGTTMNGEIKMTDANVNLQTDSTIPAGPMNVTLTWVGLYDRENDRYIKALPPTLGLNDVWLEMDEASGTVAHNSLADSESGDATYVGSPSLRVTGPFLRKAARFDGIEDYLDMGTYDGDSVFSSMDATIEFSIRTDALNGTVFAGSGQSDNSADFTPNRSEVRLVNGELVIIGHAGEQLRVRKNIADGKWHHVVISVPSVSGGNITSNKPHFVMIDGRVELARYGITFINGRSMLPASFMARFDNNYTVASNFLAGDMRDVVVRLNRAISQDTAQKLYYEWSNSVIVSPEPMVANVSMPDQFLRVTGNIKKMLVVYGLPYNAAGQTFGSDYTYASIFAGFLINNGLGASSRPQYNPGSPGVLTVRPFYIEGYLAYPVSIEGGPLNDAPGTSKRDNVDEYGYYIDDRTGLPRFINLQEDLIDVTQYDAITVVNYPAARIDGGIFGDGTNDMYTATVQGMNLQQHTTARDALRDSILQAAYDGANLWIPEIHMAQHLGFIQGFDKHSTGEWSDQQGLNTVADQLDRDHLLPNTPRSFRNGVDGYYPSIWQVNSYRRIVATEPGLTTLPGWEFGQGIMRLFYESFQPYGNLIAYDLIDRMEGLRLGDKVRMSMHNPLYSVLPNNIGGTMGWPRRFVVSARPEGIVGKVIARELETYSGPNGTTVVNRYANNAITIATERGSVVRGRSIGGRVFMEFMDTDINTVYIQEDQDKTRVSTWSLDPRRYKEIVAVFTNTRTVTRGDTTREISRTDYYLDTEDGKYLNRPYYSINARGLAWLEDASTLPAGDVKVYAPSMEMSVQTVAPKARFLRNVTSKVIGAMRLDVDFRQPASVKNPDVTVKALPFVLDLKMNGFGKKIKVEGAMTINLTTPDAQVDAGGDRIYVYIDSDRNTKLYLKEDE